MRKIQENLARSHSRTGGFTIIETLVAITILMISIAGPLVIASKGLTAALNSKDQMIASFLAQESMEVVKNMRDNNIVGNPSGYWLSVFPASCFGSNARCDASGLNFASPIMIGCISDGCQIYNTSSGYDHTNQAGATASIFKRYFYIMPVPSSCDPSSSCNEVQINVVVSWNEGIVSNNVNLSSELTNAIR